MRIIFSSIVIFSVIFLGFGISVLSVNGESKTIPDWIKNTAGWWSEDQISETEYISSLQYLIDEKIIKVNTSPITSVFATEATISDEERAHSFAVHIDNSHYDLDDTYYSFVQFFNKNEASGQPNGILTGTQETPEIILGSLPSKEKEKLYKYVAASVTPGGQIALLESRIGVSILDKNGETINKFQYRDCILLDYLVFLNFEKDEYRWGDKEGSEIRELFVFQCRGFSLETQDV